MSEPHPAEPSRAPKPGVPPPRVASETLMAGRREIIILHEQQEYHLRVTSNRKLILTK